MDPVVVTIVAKKIEAAETTEEEAEASSDATPTPPAA